MWQNGNPIKWNEKEEPWKTPRRSGNSQGRRKIFVVALVGMVAVVVVLPVTFLRGRLEFRGSEPYEWAIAAARSDPRVRAALGEPIEAGWFVTGELTHNDLSGEADLDIPIRGPQGRGTLYVTGRKENGTWEFFTLAVRVIDQDELIVLL